MVSHGSLCLNFFFDIQYCHRIEKIAKRTASSSVHLHRIVTKGYNGLGLSRLLNCVISPLYVVFL